MLTDFQKLNSLLHENQRCIWIFTGDSITHGARHTNGGRSFVEHFQERLRWELRHFLDVVINTGISGDSTNEFLDTFDDRVTRFSPTVVFVMLGMNDCKKGQAGSSLFEKNLNRIVHRIRELGAIPVLQTPNTVDLSNDPNRVELIKYVQMIREVASEKGLVLIDHYEHWQNQSCQGEVRRDWLNDAIHPNQHGHLEMAKKLFRDLEIFDPGSPTCSTILS